MTEETINDQEKTDLRSEEMNVAEENSENDNPSNELDDIRDQWLRAMAEIENVRRRGQREKEEAIRYGAVSFARDIVSTVDNLRRAVEACAHEDKSSLSASMQSLVTGVEMILSEMDSTLKRHNVNRISPLHEPFNAHYHQAMCEIESDEHPVGTVIHIMQDGYSLHDRLLRPAMVGVSKKPIVE